MSEQTTLSRSDTKLIETGIRQGWQIPPEVMDALPKRMAEIVKDGEPREAIAAARVLALLFAQNSKLKVPRKPRPQQQPIQVTTVVMEGDIDRLRQQLIDRANTLRIDTGGTSGTSVPDGSTAGSGGPAGDTG